MKATHRIQLPNGTIATRESFRFYTHVVIATEADRSWGAYRWSMSEAAAQRFARELASWPGVNADSVRVIELDSNGQGDATEIQAAAEPAAKTAPAPVAPEAPAFSVGDAVNVYGRPASILGVKADSAGRTLYRVKPEGYKAHWTGAAGIVSAAQAEAEKAADVAAFASRFSSLDAFSSTTIANILEALLAVGRSDRAEAEALARKYIELAGEAQRAELLADRLARG